MVIREKTWLAIAAVFHFNGALYGIWASRIPAIQETYGLSPGDLGLLLLLLAFGAICSFPVSGRLADALGAYRVTCWCAALYIVAFFLVPFAPGVTGLAVFLFLFGATHGSMDVAMNAWAGEAERDLGRPVMSSFHAMFSLGAGLGAGSGFLAVTAGLSVAQHFILAGLIFALPALWLGRISWRSPQRVPPEENAGPAGAVVFPRGALLGVAVMAFCTSLGEGAMIDWSALFLILTTGAGEAQATLGLGAFSVAMVIMRFLGDRVIHRLGPENAARLAGALATCGVLVAVVSAGFYLSLAGFFLIGLGYAVVMPLAFSRAANDPVIPPGTAIASVSLLGYGGLLLGPPVIGFIAEATSLRAAFGLLAALAALIILLAGYLRRTGAAS